MGNVDAKDLLGDNSNQNGGGYFLVQTKEGKLRCSCGRALEKLDDRGTYKCPGGYPIYRPEDGEVMIDKFGNLMLKCLPHTGGQNELA